ncbi:MAG TPA: ferritin-like domain-containing protein [Myxococcaceae bacterium]|nr:ferritin-like domain-containing protein [Myxococcaceae bacterium]
MRLHPSEVSNASRRIAAEAWTFRWRVELEAEKRFARMARRLAATGALPVVVDLAARASKDERRHAAHCADLARAFGADVPAEEIEAPEISPPGLDERKSVLYEVVAACCITETESTSVLTTLLHSVRAGRMRRILRELLRDEVNHSRLGWAHLAHERERSEGDVLFLDRMIPGMLEGSVPPGLFEAAPPDLESPELLACGVLPHSTKRSVFTLTLLEVVFPGLERLGVHTGPAREWLSHKVGSKEERL